MLMNQKPKRVAAARAQNSRVAIERVEPRFTFNGGYLDPAFGNGGMTLVPAPDAAGSATNFYGAGGDRIIAVPDGSFVTLVTAADSQSNARRIVVSRYHRDGTPDTTFGSNGQSVLRAVQSADAAFDTNSVGIYPAPNDGYVIVGTTDYARQDQQLVVARLDASGHALGGGSGFVTMPASWGNVYATTRDPSTGKIYIVGASHGSASSIYVYRLNPDGSPDATFGTGGSVARAELNYQGAPSAIILRPGGGYYIGGISAGLFAFTADNQMDMSFATNGIATPAAGSSFLAFASDANGGVAALIGTGSYGNSTLELVDVDSGGVVHALSGQTIVGPTPVWTVQQLLRDADGYYVAGSIEGTYSQPHSMVVRLHDDGSPDDNWGLNGMRIDDFVDPASGHTNVATFNAMAVVPGSGGDLITTDAVWVTQPGASMPTLAAGLTRINRDASDVDIAIVAPTGAIDEGTTATLGVAVNHLPDGVSIVGYDWDNDVSNGFFASAGAGASFVVSAGAGDAIRPALRVRLSDGRTLFETATIAVRNLPPTITQPIGEQFVLRGVTKGYSLTATDPADTYLTQTIDFGPAVVSGSVAYGVPYAYTMAGDYHAVATVSDGTDSVQNPFDVHVYDLSIDGERAATGYTSRGANLAGSLAPARVVLDTNANGVIDPGEPDAVPGTKSNVFYVGRNLPSGPVQLIVVPPAGYEVLGGRILRATIGNVGVWLQAVFVQTPQYVVNAYFDRNANGVRDSGSTEPLLPVYIDLDRDGKLDPDEPQALLISSLDQALFNVTTPLPAGDYVVRVVPGRINTNTLGPAAAAASAQLHVTGDPLQRVVTTLPLTPQGGSVRVYTFFDVNGDGVRQATESLFSGVRVYADLNDSGTFDSPSEPTNDISSYNQSTPTYAEGSSTIIEGLPTGTSVTLRMILPNGAVASGPLAQTIDLAGGATVYFGLASISSVAAPTVSDVQIDTSMRPAALRIRFSDDVRFANGRPANATITLTRPDGSVVSSSVLSQSLVYRSYDPTTHTLLVPLTADQLTLNGTYAVTVDGFKSVLNVSGVATTRNVTFLRGDTNGDHTVDFSDLLALAKDYGGSGKRYAQGNLDLDPFGTVDFDDLLLLAKAYGTSLPVTAAPAVAVPAAIATKSRQRSTASEVGLT